MPSPSSILSVPIFAANSFALARFSLVKSPVTTTNAGSESEEVNLVAISLTREDSADAGKNAALSFS